MDQLIRRDLQDRISRDATVARAERIITEGQEAPDFIARDWKGNMVHLHDGFPGRTWLAFFRYGACPMCLLRVNELVRRYPQWAAEDFRVLAVFHSTPQRIAGNVGRMEPPFTLISDPELELYNLYGIERPGNQRLFNLNVIRRLATAICRGYRGHARDGEPLDVVPADFLIDEAGRVSRARYGADMGDHMPFEEVERWLGFRLGEN